MREIGRMGTDGGTFVGKIDDSNGMCVCTHASGC